VARNRFEQAEAAFRKAVELNPDSAQAPIALARILLSQDGVAETDTVLARVEAIRLRSPAVVLLRTVAVIAHDKLPEASRLSAAVAINVKDVSLERAGHLDAARAAHFQAIQLDSSYAHRALNLARIARVRQDRAGEKQVLTEFLERTPTQPDVMAALARMAFGSAQGDEALGILERARAANAKHGG
jgi:Flp pilus assembly protein TadD